MRRTRRVDAKKCRDGALPPMIRYKVLYLCFSSEQAAEAYQAYAAQGASKEKSAETVPRLLIGYKVLYLCFSCKQVEETHY